MIAIFRRELRKNATWAAVAMVVITATLAVMVYSMRDDPSDGIVLVNMHSGAIMVIGDVAVGVVLGVLAVWPDYTVGTWSLLTHRPTGRWRIFCGKHLAAIVLSGLAGGIPFLGLVAWAATPGHVAAPFDWRMALPGLVALVGGWCAASSAMLTAARRAWLGSRLLPIAALALICAYVFTGAISLGLAALVLLAATAVFAVAAGGSFAAHGEFESQRWITRLMQTIAIGVGAVVAVMVFDGMTTAYLDSLYPVSFRTVPLPLTLDAAGNIGIDEANRARAGHIFIQGDWTNGSPQPVQPIFMDTDHYGYMIKNTGVVRWYFVPGRNTVELYTVELYSTPARRYIGSIGPAGLVFGAPPQPFPEPVMVSVDGLVLGRSRIWQINMETGQTDLAYTAPPGERIIGANLGVSLISPSPETPAVITQSAVHVLGARNRQVAAIHLDRRAWGSQGIWLAHPSKDSFVLLCTPQNLLIHADGSGRITDEMIVPEAPRFDTPTPTPQQVLSFRIAGGVTGSPIIVALGAWPFAEARDWWIALAGGLLSALAAIPLLNRYEMTRPGRLLWIFLIASLGLAGIILLLCTRTAIVRMECRACGRKRSVAEVRCRHCGNPFPPPAKTGVEIFESRRAMEVGI